MIHTIWFCLFVFQTSRKTSTFYQRNDAITYDEAFIYYLYQQDVNFVRVKTVTMGIHFQLLSPPVTTVSSLIKKGLNTFDLICSISQIN